MTASDTTPTSSAHDRSPAARRLAEVEALSGIGSWEWEIASDRLVWSDQLRRIYGVLDTDAELSYADFISRVHPDDRDEVAATVQRAFEARDAFAVDHRIVLPDGTIREIHGRGHVLVGEDGNPERMLGSAQDVTEARAAEARRRRCVPPAAASLRQHEPR